MLFSPPIQQNFTNTVYSEGEVLLISINDVIWWWKEYFSDIFNDTNMCSAEEAEFGDIWTEVAEVGSGYGFSRLWMLLGCLG